MAGRNNEMNDFMMVCGTPFLAIAIITFMFLAIMAVFDPEGFADLIESWRKYL